MPDPFKRTDSLNDGPIMDMLNVFEGDPAPEGLTTRMASSGSDMFAYELYHNPNQGGTGLFRRLLHTPDGRVRMFYRTWETFIQPVAPGIFARWILYPPQSVRTVGPKQWRLWRFEGPNRIQNVDSLEWVTGVPGQPNAAWLAASYTTPPRSIDTARGRVWVDGGGIPYGVEKPGGGWQPTALPYNSPWYFLNGNPASDDWVRTDITPDDLVNDVKKGREYVSGSHPGVYLPWTFGPEFFRARDSLQFTDAQIKAMRPSELVRLYYGMGKWVMDDQCPVYESPYWPQPEGARRSFATYAAVVEYQLRDRIYALRPDLHTVKLADGSEIPGLISYRDFPPRDGLQCVAKTGLDQIASAFSLVASILPGIGIWASVMQFANQLADTLDAIEARNKVAAFTTNLTTGATALTAVDAATHAGNTGGTGATNTDKTGNAGMLLALAAVAAVVVARS